MKITQQQFKDFEQQFLLEKIANPTYRFGQAFWYNFPQAIKTIEYDEARGHLDSDLLWNTDDRKKVLEIIKWYNLME